MTSVTSASNFKAVDKFFFFFFTARPGSFFFKYFFWEAGVPYRRYWMHFFALKYSELKRFSLQDSTFVRVHRH
jgi:hypothetical protein